MKQFFEHYLTLFWSSLQHHAVNAALEPSNVPHVQILNCRKLTGIYNVSLWLGEGRPSNKKCKFFVFINACWVDRMVVPRTETIQVYLTWSDFLVCKFPESFKFCDNRPLALTSDSYVSFLLDLCIFTKINLEIYTGLVTFAKWQKEKQQKFSRLLLNHQCW